MFQFFHVYTMLTMISLNITSIGKEKEGIPQEFLNVIDQCVEIPQLGVIRR